MDVLETEAAKDREYRDCKQLRIVARAVAAVSTAPTASLSPRIGRNDYLHTRKQKKEKKEEGERGRGRR